MILHVLLYGQNICVIHVATLPVLIWIYIYAYLYKCVYIYTYIRMYRHILHMCMYGSLGAGSRFFFSSHHLPQAL